MNFYLQDVVRQAILVRMFPDADLPSTVSLVQDSRSLVLYDPSSLDLINKKLTKRNEQSKKGIVIVIAV